MDEYLTELLAVELPSFDQQKNETVASTCMSLKDIHYIMNILRKNSAEIKTFDPSLVKYMDRIQHADEIRTSTKNDPSIFEPTPDLYKYTAINTDAPLTERQFKVARHYVMLQSFAADEEKPEENSLERWEVCLVKILLEISLNSYCTKTEKLSKCTNLEELFYQIYKYPRDFLLNTRNEGKVKIMAYILANHFKSAEPEGLLKSLKGLHEHYQKCAAANLARCRETEQYLQMAINSLSNKVNVVKGDVERDNRDLFQCAVARMFLSQYTCRYEIVKIKDPLACSNSKNSNKTDTNELQYQYKIVFKKETKRKFSQEESFKLAEYSFGLTIRFLEDYSHRPAITSAITSGEDKANICQVFRSYFEHLKTFLYTVYPATAKLPKKDKEGIFELIYDYAMVKIHSNVFPKQDGAKDRQFAEKIDVLSKFTAEQLKVTRSNNHQELMSLFMNSFLAHNSRTEERGENANTEGQAGGAGGHVQAGGEFSGDIREEQRRCGRRRQSSSPRLHLLPHPTHPRHLQHQVRLRQRVVTLSFSGWG